MPVDGTTIKFEDITFFPFAREDFESARLNIEQPKNSDGDPTGDLAMGRQQLLLLWLLGGEYISLNDFDVQGKPLDEILKQLKTTTKIPRLEGYEWANLQRFNLLKSKAFVRIKGASEKGSAFQELFVKQLHDAAKAGIRTAFARMVADAAGNELVLKIKRSDETDNTSDPIYGQDGCLAIESADPAQWTQHKACQAFEEYIASAAARTVLAGLPLFTAQEVFEKVHRFWRIKGDAETIDKETDADQFLAAVSTFIGGIPGDVDAIGGVVAATRPIYEQTVGQPDPGTPARSPAARQANLDNVQKKIKDLATGVSLHIIPRFSNRGFSGASQVMIRMFRGDGTGIGQPINPEDPPLRIDLAGYEEKFLATDGGVVSGDPLDDPTPEERNLNDLAKQESSDAKPLFMLGDKEACKAQPGGQRCLANPPLDLNPAAPRWVAFTIDLPEKKQKEPDRQNNYDGFFYYILDRESPATPTTPSKVPLPITDTGNLLDPDPSCQDAPDLTITQRMLVNGVPYTDTVTLAPAQQTTLELTVKNESGQLADGVNACSSLTGQCYSIGTIAANGVSTATATYTAPSESRIVDGLATVSSKQFGLSSAPILRVIVGCEANSIVPFDPNPNPAVSVVMQGGTALRYYRVVDRQTGAPVGGAAVTLEVGSPATTIRTYEYLTDVDGVIATDGKRGMAIRWDDAFPLGSEVPARFTKVGGVAGSCGATASFTVVNNERAFTSTLRGGNAIHIEGAFEGMDGQLRNGFGFVANVESTLARDNRLVFERTLTAKPKVGATQGTRSDVDIDVEATFSASISGGFGPVFMARDEHVFPMPLSTTHQLAVGTLGLTAAAFAQTVGVGLTTAGPAIGHLINAGFEKLTGLDATRTSVGTAFGVEVAANTTLGDHTIQLGKADKPDVNTGLGVKIGVKAEGEAAVLGSVDLRTDQSPPELRGSVEDRARADISGGINVALLKIEQEALTPGGQYKIDEVDKIRASANKLLEKLTIAGSGNFAGNMRFNAAIDSKTQQLTAISFSIQSQKQYGFKLAGQTIVNGGDGSLRTVTYRITDPARFTTALQRMALLQASVLGTSLAGAIGSIVTPLIGPDLVGEELTKLIALADEYEIAFEKGKGVEVPFGLDEFVEGTGLGAKLLLNVDASTTYLTERGAVRRGEMFKLEEYLENDPLIPANRFDFIVDAIKSGQGAMKTLSKLYQKGKELITQGPGVPNTDYTRNFSPSGITLSVNGSAEPIATDPFVIDVYAYQYLPVPGSGGMFLRSPGDILGPPEYPHYGIGGFFQLLPNKRALAAPARLTIRWLPIETEGFGFNESAIGIYKWNEDSADWDFLGGTVDTVNDQVSIDITELGLYTAGLPMPAGDIDFTAQAVIPGDPLQPIFATYTSSQVHMNTGGVVPDGTLFTIYTLVGDSNEIDQLAPFGIIETADADINLPGVQVRSTNGRIQFAVTYPAGSVVPHVLAFATHGTATGHKAIDLRQP